MSEKKKYREILRKIATYILSTVCGAAAAICCLLLFGIVMDGLGLPPVIAGVAALAAYGAGCLVSGMVCGCIKKHSGLRHGFRCAVIMSVLMITGAAVCGTLDGTEAVAKTITAVLTGCAGGVIGVNRSQDSNWLL